MTGERCQFDDTIYRLRFPYGHVRASVYALRRLRDRFRKPTPVGKPSRYRTGDWVRVKSADEIRATLDGEDKLRGLLFLDSQWSYCGRTYRVDRVLRRLRDDERRFCSISRTVALAGVTCDGVDGTGGCGRSCSLYFRDEWLEPSSEEEHVPRTPTRFARVRPWNEIIATLDRHGRRDGMSVMPEMEQFAGRRFPVLRRAGDAPLAQPSYRQPGGEFYVLDGVRCSGAAFAQLGPCDRHCGIFWHRDWLELEEE